MQILNSFQKFVTSEEYKKYKFFYLRLNTVCREHFELELLSANHVTPEVKKNYTFCTPQRSQIFEMTSEFAYILPNEIKSHFPGAGRHNKRQSNVREDIRGDGGYQMLRICEMEFLPKFPCGH